MRLGRRGLIRALLLALATIPGLLPRARVRWLGAALDAEAAPSLDRLSRFELADLVAFAELLVDARPLTAVARAALVVEIEDRAARDSDYLSLYRTTARLLDRLGGRRFASLDAPARVALVRRHRLDSTDVRPGDDLGPFADDVRLVRTRAVRDLVADYYVSPAGWAVVGYDTFPGRCGDLERYTRRER